ncbi:hypothetical protein DASC09_043520 [Saccharomycopsis crataegensis]|uniref:Amidase domain-containing protein n=1 Tax=Saccharomycopsis crataegensis TaxID=43959 RepID=A0AAV5QRD9_9ASCO|nr:hypothetical protein DASC09_043520 [Saccharomycopsis crataegensis]
MSYKEISAKKRAERDTHLISEWLIPEDKLPKENDVLEFPVKSGYLSASEIEITESDAPTIFENIKSHKWSSYDVTKAFCHRSQIAHQLTNCLSEIFYAEGLQQAKALDEYYATTGKLKGRFHGVPISLKDNINVIGQASSIGYVDWCFKPEGGFTTDSAIAELLRKEGAVFYCKTNVPVAMMMPESTNHVYGTTTNPLNRLLSAGGSSGGAAAHAALKGSIIDIGSDIGGSIRIPASFNSLYALRPTSGRYPTYGTRSGLPGLESVNSVNGPLCTSLASMEWYLSNLVDADPSTVDPKVCYSPWKKVTLPEKLTFAILKDDGHVKPTPPIQRGIDMVQKLVEEAGHEVIEWDPSEHVALAQTITKFFLADGGKHVLEVTEATGEPLFPSMAMYGSAPSMSVSELWDLHAERSGNCKKLLQRWMDTQLRTKDGKVIDAILLPASPHPGCPHGKFGGWVGYTSVFNATDYSVGVMPVSRCDKAVDLAEKDYVPRNAIDKEIYESYDPEVSHGGSVSIQVACRKNEDEKVVELIKRLSKLVKYSG